MRSLSAILFHELMTQNHDSPPPSLAWD